MRIDSFSQIQQLYGLNNKPQKSRTSGDSAFLDTLQVSDSGKDYQVAKNAMGQVSDIRDDRIAELKAQIQEGTYDVSAEDFADKILSKYQASGAIAF